MKVFKSILLAALLCCPALVCAQPAQYGVKRQMESLLANGIWQSGRPLLRPFLFRTPDGLAARAQNSGLEGFYYTKTELETRFPPDYFAHHYTDYFGYIDYVLSKSPLTDQFRVELKTLQESKLPPAEINFEFNRHLGAYIEKLQAEYRVLNQARWVRTARIYQIFPRAYNIAGRRTAAGIKAEGELTGRFFADFADADFKPIADMGFDTIWVMGIYPVGETARMGTAGGSVYSVKDPDSINPDLGTEAEFKAFVARAHANGFKVIIDFVANHTSQDSTMLAENPEYFINVPAPLDYDAPVPPNHFPYTDPSGKKYFVRWGSYDCGGETLCTWNDVAQLNYANPALRDRLARTLTGWMERADVDGFRVDMAYQNLNSVFSRNYNMSMPNEETFTFLINRARGVNPAVAFIAEAYDNQEELSAAGFDLFYNKSEWSRLEGQTGWYDAFMHANPAEIVPAINREAFLSWQEGGAAGLSFFINHDEPAARKIFGNRLPAVAMLTMLQPGAVLFYNGAEIGFDGAVPGETKTLPFSVPVSIDWDKADKKYSAMMTDIIMRAKSLRAELGDYTMKPLFPRQGEKWCGFVLVPSAGDRQSVAVLANAVNEPVRLDISYPAYNLRFKGVFAPGEYKIIRLKEAQAEAAQ